jgi:hypothetical protein
MAGLVNQAKPSDDKYGVSITGEACKPAKMLGLFILLKLLTYVLAYKPSFLENFKN